MPEMPDGSENLEFSFDDIVAQVESVDDDLPATDSSKPINNMEENRAEGWGGDVAGADVLDGERKSESGSEDAVGEVGESASVDGKTEPRGNSGESTDGRRFPEDGEILEGDGESSVQLEEKKEGGCDPESADSSGGELKFDPLDPESVGGFLREMGVPESVVESKKCLIEVMQRENALLDRILEAQNEIHDRVRRKDWEGLSERLDALEALSVEFEDLEVDRTTLSELVDIRIDEDFSDVLRDVRGKLERSKIENRALNEYVTVTRRFLEGVLDSAVQHDRNVLYSKSGKVVHPKPSGIALDITL